MAVLKVLTYPDPFLKKNAQEVTVFNQELKELAADMADTMYDQSGLGLAAPQVGQGLRLFVADLTYRPNDPEHPRNWIAYVNPVIKKGEGEQFLEEGCLSVPEYRAEIKRFQNITIEYNDLEGNLKKVTAEGLFAVCIQHEMDHLAGKLFIDYLPPLKRKMIQKRLKKLAEE